MTPDVADKLAKLLRMTTSSHDGEVLAAVNRINALVTANAIDWDAVFANGNGAALTEKQMSRIYIEGYERGLRDGQQKARPERDWTPAGSAEAGQDNHRLEIILEAAAAAEADGLLSEWEVDFTGSMRERIRTYGSRTYVSERQWKSIDRLEAKLRIHGYMPD
jgi:uncharacterized membrane protein YebE (DUF533 family)